ncbi:MAG: TM0106 family RecB-like putative nuclease [Mycobacteriaceae bacterium]
MQPLLDAGALSRCRHRVLLDTRDPDFAAQSLVDSGVRQRRESATAHRNYVRSLLLLESPVQLVEIAPELPTKARVEATIEACRSGVERIWGAVLPADRAIGRKGGVELLIRDDTGYSPVIVVNHKVTDVGAGACISDLRLWNPHISEHHKVRSQPRDYLRLAHLTRMLQDCGFASESGLGGAIGFAADCVVIHDIATMLDGYDEHFKDRMAVAKGEISSAPSKIGECKTCPWWSQCKADLIEVDDVSLVVSGAKADTLRQAGINTVHELALWDQKQPEQWSGNGFDDAIVMAKAFSAGIPLIRRYDEVTVHRADIEVDVDMESYQELGAYMWGTLVSDTRVRADQGTYRSFFTWDPLPTTDEARAFGEFWSWLMQVREDAHSQGLTFAAYCYSKAAENKWLLSSAIRFSGLPAIPTVAEVQAFIAGHEWVDIYEAVTAQFVCPGGKGLKKIAPLAGFSWRDAEAGGEASMSWYREAVGLDDGGVNISQRTRLLEYNEDDVRATKVLREWMVDKAGDEVPLAVEISG